MKKTNLKARLRYEESTDKFYIEHLDEDGTWVMDRCQKCQNGIHDEPGDDPILVDCEMLRLLAWLAETGYDIHFTSEE